MGSLKLRHSLDLIEVVGAEYCLRLDLGNYLIDSLFPFWEPCGKPLNISCIKLGREIISTVIITVRVSLFLFFRLFTFISAI